MKTKRLTELKKPEAAEAVANTDTPPEMPETGFPVVGIGASAGGLAAFEAFFSGMPADADPGMAFVLVQHLAPDHESLLTELIRRYTRMQVFEVADGMVVRPNCAYIIPPNHDMAFIRGTLQLLEPSAPRGQRLPVDFFFRSLAQLSGTTTDLRDLLVEMTRRWPQEPAFQNEHAYLNLLLGEDPEEPRQTVAALLKESPANGAYRTTFALALWRQKDFASALRAYEGQAGDWSQSPASQRVVYAAVLAANNRADEARQIARALPANQLRPEELELLKPLL